MRLVITTILMAMFVNGVAVERREFVNLHSELIAIVDNLRGSGDLHVYENNLFRMNEIKGFLAECLQNDEVLKEVAVYKAISALHTDVVAMSAATEMALHEIKNGNYKIKENESFFRRLNERLLTDIKKSENENAIPTCISHIKSLE